MARLTAELPLVVLAGSRPGPLPGWASLPNVEVVELSGLDPAATEQLGSAVAGASLDPAVASWLHERTAGNALFIGEIVRALCETGGLERVAGQLRLADGAARDRLPLSLRALLGARIDSLPADQRAALEVASVIGMDFTEPLLRDLDPGLDGSELDELARAGLVEAVGGDDGETHHWQFRHPLFHDAAYGRLLGERRRRLHASLADLLATAEPPTTAAELARHRVAAGDLDAALPLLERAALEAASVGAAMEAAEFRRAAADLVERETWMAARWPGDDQPAVSPRDRGDSAAT